MLQAKIESELNYSTCVPYFGEEYDLETGELVKEKIIRVRKVKAAKPSLSDASFKKVNEALKRLQNVVFDSENYPNKQKEKLANQINDLANKWEHNKF